MKIKIELAGVLRGKAGWKSCEADVDKGIDVLDLIQWLKSHYEPLSSEFPDLRSSHLILLNDREIGVVDGLRTKLKNGDRVTIIPVSHGG